MLSSFVIILLVTALLTKVLKNKYVQAALCGMKPCIIGIVLATGCFMVINTCFNIKSAGGETDIVAIVLTAALSLAFFISKKVMKKGISPILLIVVSAACGIIAYGRNVPLPGYVKPITFIIKKSEG